MRKIFFLVVCGQNDKRMNHISGRGEGLMGTPSIAFGERCIREIKGNSLQVDVVFFFAKEGKKFGFFVGLR